MCYNDGLLGMDANLHQTIWEVINFNAGSELGFMQITLNQTLWITVRLVKICIAKCWQSQSLGKGKFDSSFTKNFWVTLQRNDTSSPQPLLAVCNSVEGECEMCEWLAGQCEWFKAKLHHYLQLSIKLLQLHKGLYVIISEVVFTMMICVLVSILTVIILSLD